MRYPSNIQSFDCIPNGAKSGKYHPTQKPVALLEYLIRTYTLEGETVLDNTMGSGSTGVAAINLKRKFIGIEQDDKYFAIAEKRIAEAQKKCLPASHREAKVSTDPHNEGLFQLFTSR